ncbi:MAG TPA: DUF4416 family protein, partial [Phycisphaerae bacterium]|nr:DUF4416 family protein [Phycisphaerae bacterium]
MIISFPDTSPCQPLTWAPAVRDNAIIMAQIHTPSDVAYICGIISSRAELFDDLTGPLEKALGPIEQVSAIMPFDLTDYYKPEMGSGLLKRFVSFAPRRGPDFLARAKLATNEIEADFAKRFGPVPQRPVNLDPGYITLAKLVLASMKDFSHRIYLSDG